MNASKEEARSAKRKLKQILERGGAGAEDGPNATGILEVIRFLERAEKKLPREQSYEREAVRRERSRKARP